MLDWNLKLFCRLLVKHFKLMCISKLQNIHACIKLFYIFEPTVNAITVDSRLFYLVWREGSWRMRYFRSFWIPSEVKTQIIKIFLDYFVIFTTCKLTKTLSLPLSSTETASPNNSWNSTSLLQMCHKYRVIRKSLRNFRTRLRNNQERQGRKEHINR